jgi:hypothetical protein
MQPEGIRSEFLRPAQEDYSRLIARLSFLQTLEGLANMHK